MALATRELELVLIARDRASATIARVGGAFTILGGSIAGIGALASREFGRMVEEASNFRRDATLAFTQVDGVANASLRNIERSSIDIGRRTAVVFDDIQGSYYDLFSTIDVSNMKDADAIIREFAKSAVAGKAPMEDIGRNTIAWLNALNQPATFENTRRLLNIQFELVRKGAGSYEEIAANVGKAIPAFTAAEQSVETFSGVFAFLTRNGLNAAQASTSAARAIELMFSKKGIDGMKKYGINVSDNTGRTRKMSDVLRDLLPLFREQDGTLKDIESRKDIFHEIFGTGRIQARRFFDVAIPNFEELLELTRAMEREGATGAGLERAFQLMSEDPAAQLQIIRNELEAFRIDVGSKLFDTITKFAYPAVTLLGDAWYELSDAQRKQIAQMGAVAAGLLAVGGAALAGVGSLILISTLLASFPIQFGAAAIGAKLLADSLEGVGPNILRNWEDIMLSFERAWVETIESFEQGDMDVMNIWRNLFFEIGNLIGLETETITQMFNDSYSKWFGPIVDYNKDKWIDAFDIANDVIKNKMPAIGERYEEELYALGPSVSAAVGFMFGDPLTKLLSVGVLFAEWGKVKKYITDFWTGDQAEKLLEDLKREWIGEISPAINNVITDFSGWWSEDSGKEFTKAEFSGVQDRLFEVIETLLRVFSEIGGVLGVIGSALTGIDLRDITEGDWEQIISNIANELEDYLTIINSVLSLVEAALTGDASLVNVELSKLDSALKDIAPTIINTVFDMINNTIDLIQGDAVGTIWNSETIQASIEAIQQGMRKTIDNIFGSDLVGSGQSDSDIPSDNFLERTLDSILNDPIGSIILAGLGYKGAKAALKLPGKIIRGTLSAPKNIAKGAAAHQLAKRYLGGGTGGASQSLSNRDIRRLESGKGLSDRKLNKIARQRVAAERFQDLITERMDIVRTTTGTPTKRFRGLRSIWNDPKGVGRYFTGRSMPRLFPAAQTPIPKVGLHSRWDVGAQRYITPSGQFSGRPAPFDPLKRYGQQAQMPRLLQGLPQTFKPMLTAVGRITGAASTVLSAISLVQNANERAVESGGTRFGQGIGIQDTLLGIADTVAQTISLGAVDRAFEGRGIERTHVYSNLAEQIEENNRIQDEAFNNAISDATFSHQTVDLGDKLDNIEKAVIASQARTDSGARIFRMPTFDVMKDLDSRVFTEYFHDLYGNLDASADEFLKFQGNVVFSTDETTKYVSDSWEKAIGIVDKLLEDLSPGEREYINIEAMTDQIETAIIELEKASALAGGANPFITMFSIWEAQLKDKDIIPEDLFTTIRRAWELLGEEITEQVTQTDFSNMMDFYLGIIDQVKGLPPDHLSDILGAWVLIPEAIRFSMTDEMKKEIVNRYLSLPGDIKQIVTPEVLAEIWTAWTKIPEAIRRAMTDESFASFIDLYRQVAQDIRDLITPEMLAEIMQAWDTIPKALRDSITPESFEQFLAKYAILPRDIAAMINPETLGSIMVAWSLIPPAIRDTITDDSFVTFMGHFAKLPVEIAALISPEQLGLIWSSWELIPIELRDQITHHDFSKFLKAFADLPPEIAGIITPEILATVWAAWQQLPEDLRNNIDNAEFFQSIIDKFKSLTGGIENEMSNAATKVGEHAATIFDFMRRLSNVEVPTFNFDTPRGGASEETGTTSGSGGDPSKGWTSPRGRFHPEGSHFTQYGKEYKIVNGAPVLVNRVPGIAPGYQTGAGRILNDGLAFLHRNERVMPAKATDFQDRMTKELYKHFKKVETYETLRGHQGQVFNFGDIKSEADPYDIGQNIGWQVRVA